MERMERLSTFPPFGSGKKRMRKSKSRMGPAAKVFSSLMQRKWERRRVCIVK